MEAGIISSIDFHYPLLNAKGLIYRFKLREKTI